MGGGGCSPDARCTAVVALGSHAPSCDGAWGLHVRAQSAAESSDSEDAMLKRIQEANKRLAAVSWWCRDHDTGRAAATLPCARFCFRVALQLAAGEVVDEEPVKKPPRRVKTLRDIPIYDRPFAGEPFPRERDARGRKIPTRKTRVTKVSGCHTCACVGSFLCAPNVADAATPANALLLAGRRSATTEGTEASSPLPPETYAAQGVRTEPR